MQICPPLTDGCSSVKNVFYPDGNGAFVPCKVCDKDDQQDQPKRQQFDQASIYTVKAIATVERVDVVFSCCTAPSEAARGVVLTIFSFRDERSSATVFPKFQSA